MGMERVKIQIANRPTQTPSTNVYHGIFIADYDYSCSLCKEWDWEIWKKRTGTIEMKKPNGEKMENGKWNNEL